MHAGAARGEGSRLIGWARNNRRWLKPLAAALVLGLAAFLLYRTLSRYDFDELFASVKSIPLSRLGTALLFAAASYFCLTLFDFLALRYVGHPLPYRKAALASFISLSLGHNIGFAALSSGAVRYRFYSRWGLDAEAVGKLILFCGVTVGLGLIALGGMALVLRSELAAEIIGLSRAAVLALGALCLAVPLAYLALAVWVTRPLTIRGWSFAMPGLRIAAAQIVVGTVNFACVAACLHQVLLGVEEIPYLSVATVYVAANLASLVSHVPGGLGVIEAVVVHLLPGCAADRRGARLPLRLFPCAAHDREPALPHQRSRAAARGRRFRHSRLSGAKQRRGAGRIDQARSENGADRAFADAAERGEAASVGVQLLDRADQRPLACDRCRHRVRIAVEMLAEKPRPHAGDAFPRRCIGRFDGEVAFKVEPGRAVVQIGRADAKEAIVDDDELGVDEHLAFAVGGRHDRMPEPQPPVAVGPLQLAHQPLAVAVHEDALDKAVRRARRPPPRPPAPPAPAAASRSARRA